MNELSFDHILGLTNVPKTTPIGTSILLMELKEASKFFPGRSRQQLGNTLRALGVPLFYDKENNTFFNLYTLEKILFYLLRVGGDGFAAPGSIYRMKQHYKGAKYPPCLQVTEEDIQEMNSPEVAAERLATGPKGKGGRVSYLATLRDIEKNLRNDLRKELKETSKENSKETPKENPIQQGEEVDSS